MKQTSGKKDDRGIILVSFLLLIVVLFIGVSSFYVFAYADYFASVRNEYLTQAFYVAEAGIDQKLMQLATTNTSSITGSLTANSYSGTYSVTYQVDAVTGAESLISTGTVTADGTSYSRSVRVTVRKDPLINPLAAVSISGVASTNGNITVDGRNYDSNGNLIVGDPGKPGISTSSSTFIQGGNSKVGGNGIAPANPALPTTYVLNAPPLPATPEAILGLSDGSLDAYKTSTPPPTPFNGIVYLTTNWDPVNFEGSSGILICHNAVANATLENVHGGFKGLIITDDLIHINGDADILGAVVGLKTGGVTLGNGSGTVRYSSQVLANLPLVRYTVTSWEDTKND